MKGSFFTGIDTSLMGIADLARAGDAAFLKTGLGRINSTVEQAMKEFSPQHPDRIAPLLAQGLKTTDSLIGQVASSGLSAEAKYDITHELKVKQAQFNSALAESLSLSMRAALAPEHPPTGPFARFFGTPPSFQLAIPGQTFWVRVHMANQGSLPVTISKLWLAGAPGETWAVSPLGETSESLAGNQARSVRFRVTAPENAVYTKLYFARPTVEQAYYNVLNPRDLNLPLAPLSAGSLGAL